jgi:hypothetical protein
MPEHLIRLRAAWDCQRCDGGAVPCARIDLPVVWADHDAGPNRLSRSFGRPEIDAAREALWLRLDDVPGLRCVRLNGAVLLTPETRGGSSHELRLPHSLLPRNTLELEVQPPSSRSDRSPWGRIALVIRPRAQSAGDSAGSDL